MLQRSRVLVRIGFATSFAAAALAACVGDDPITGPSPLPDAGGTLTPDGGRNDGDSGSGDGDGGEPLRDAGTDTGTTQEDAGRFDPTSLAGLQLWLDANEVSGSSALNWVDQVSRRAGEGTGRYGADAATENCVAPARIADAVGTNAVLRFNGSTNCVVLGNDFHDRFRDLRKGMTAFFVTRAGAAGANDIQAVIDFSPRALESGDYFALARRGSNPVYQVANPMTGQEQASSNVGAFLQGEVTVITVSSRPGDAGAFSTNGIRLFLDGQAAATSTQPVIHVPAVVNRSLTTIGRYVPGSGSPTFLAPGWFRGDIGEILVWFRELSDSERAQVDAYLKARWLD